MDLEQEPSEDELRLQAEQDALHLSQDNMAQVFGTPEGQLALEFMREEAGLNNGGWLVQEELVTGLPIDAVKLHLKLGQQQLVQKIEFNIEQARARARER